MLIRTVPVLLACVVLSGCGANTKYEWGNYPTSLLDYYQDPTTQGKYVAQLDAIVASEAKGKKVPPGIFAEAGYMALAQGDTRRAVEFFEREKRAWPESAVFMDKAIGNATGRSQQPAPAAPVRASTTPTS